MHNTPDLSKSNAGGSKLFMASSLVSFTGLLIYLKLGMVFILLSLLPSVITFYLDRARGRATFKTVLACNLASAVHPIADLYSRGVRMSYDRVNEAFYDIRVWLFIYMGAAAGWGLIYFCRFLAHFTVDTYHEYQVFHLKKQQEWLTQEWGKSIVPDQE